jgi:hypothetical protein
MEPDVSRWSGDGDFTQRLVDVLATVPEIVALRVEDAPAGHQGTGCAFLSNEIYVAFSGRDVVRPVRLLGILPWRRRVREPAMTLEALEAWLAGREGIGPPDYSDEGMLQYLRTERVKQPYQTRGVKLVELVRLYCFGATPKR